MKKLIFLFLLIAAVLPALHAQTCNNEKGFFSFPFTQNGMTVTGTGTGSFSAYSPTYLACGIPFAANSVWIGQTGPATYTNTFSIPVNDMVYKFGGSNVGEIMTVTVNSGTPSITLLSSTCPSDISISGNVISFPTGGNQGGMIKVHSTSTFTSITFSHNGGQNGSLVDMCFDEVFASVQPTVTTTSVSAITFNTAVSGGNVTNDGGSAVTSRGVCWSTSANPTIANSKTIDGSGLGSFSSSLTGLASGTTYHVRAYATNANGTAYGSDVSFTTSTDVTPPIVSSQNVTVQLNSSGQASIVTAGFNSPIFTETFGSDGSGLRSTLTNWNFASAGMTVDVGEYITGNGSTEIDLAGNNNATITTKKTFLFVPGQYILTFDNRLNDNPAGGNSVKVTIGSLLNQTFVSNVNATPESVTFTVSQTTSAAMTFEQLGTNDAAGSFIGNIKLSRVIPQSYSVLVSATDDNGLNSVSVTKSTFNCSNLGSNPIQVTVTDVYNNVTIQNVTVTVEDNIDPVLTAGANQNVNLNSSCAIVVPDVRGTATDNCSVTITQSPAAGSVVSSSHNATVNVTVTATDAGGNTDIKTVVLTAKDVTPPVITCPANISVNNGTNQCGAVITYALPVATDNCSGGAFNYFNPGEPNNAGSEDHLQLYNSGTWNDLNGSVSMVYIIEVNSIYTNSIPNHTRIGEYDGHTYYRCNVPAPWNTARTNALALGIGADLASINTLGESSFLAPYGGSTWVGGYQDHSDPDYAEPGNASQNWGGWKWVDGTKLGAGQIAIIRTAGFASGTMFPIGTTTVTHTATDQGGNVSSCSFTVTVTDNQKPVITTNGNKNVNTDAGRCDAAVSVSATATDNCSVGAPTGVRSDALALSAPYPRGTTTITWNVTDVNGVAALTVTQTVIVTDNQAPVPNVATLPTVTGECSASVTAPTATDACAGSITGTTTDPTSYSTQGTFIVHWKYDDGNGNSSTQNQTVVIDDNTPPVITCPFNITVNADAGQCGATVTYNQPSATDNCGSGVLPTSIPGYTYKGIFQGHAYFISNSATTPEAAHAAAIATGGHLVTINSAAENTFVANFNSTTRIWIGYTDRVTEGVYKWVTNEPVTFTNWAAGEPNNAGDEDWAVINWTGVGTWNDWTFGSSALYAIEFEGGAIPTTLVSGPASGGFFPVGTTPVTYSATDAGGNTVTCSFTVTVVDNIPPTISCPSNKTVTACTTTIGDYRSEAIASDNCSTVTVTQSPAPGSGIGAGSTVTVILTATDGVGLTKNCTFTVTRPLFVASISGATAFCQGLSTTLTASAGSSYTWNTGATTQSITVSQAGTYSVTVRNADGCTATANVTVVVNPLPTTTITPNGPTTICQGNTVTLDGGAGFASYLWNTGATTRTITVGTAGNYSVTVTDANGCTSGGVGGGGLFAVSGARQTPSTLYKLDPATGALITTVGATGYNHVTGLTIHPGTGELYAFANEITGSFAQGALLKLNPTTGAGTFVANVSLQVPDMAFSSTGVLYAWSEHNDGLWTINTTTGAVTSAGPGGQGTARTGLSFTPSGKLYMKDHFRIRELDPANGATLTSVNYSGFTNNLLTSDVNGVLYTGERSGSTFILKTIDPLTGAIVTKGSAPLTNISGITFGGGASISITVNTAPTITCPADVSTVAANGQCGANVSYPNATVTGTPAPTVTYSRPSGSFFPVGTTPVTVTASNSCGTVSCTFNVTVTDNQKPVITHNGNKSVFALPGQCSANPIVSASATDNCSVGAPTGVRSDAQALNAPYPVGTTTITWNVTDVNGNAAIAVTQTVTVTDNQPPVITNMPANIVKNAASLNCNALVTWAKPTVSDNCPGATLTSDDDDYNTLGFSLLSVGVHVITFTATDAHGNSSSASFTVTIVDNQVPIITGCPANINVNTAPGTCSAQALWNPPTASDNCPGVSLSGNHISGETFPKGTTTVTYTATDAAGLTTTCSFTVTVNDTEAPSITCPGSQSINMDGACSATLPDYRNLVTVSDNCPGALPVTQSPAPGTVVTGTGAMTVTFTVTDAAGNSKQCSITVNKKDVTPPAITCPQPVVVNNDPGVCGAKVTFNGPTATDNCSPNISGSQQFSYSGSITTWTVPAGVTKVTIDAFGAQGGNVTVSCNATGGKGAKMSGEFAVTPGEVLSILVGGQGQTGQIGNEAGGGGGTFVVRQSNIPLIVAGGGGGATNTFGSCGPLQNGMDAVTTTSGTTGANGQGAGGINGNGGTSLNSNGGAGGGFYTNGTGQDPNSQGRAYVNGGAGGQESTWSPGGFGGGGGGWCCGGNGGGGGGYSGGGTSGGYPYTGGGGGGSYNIGANQSNAPGVNTGNGKVVISWQISSVAITQTAGLPSGSVFPVGTTTNTFVATDSSGNSSTCSFTVTVNDTEKPKLVGVPASATVECDAVPAAATVTATDNCPGVGAVQFTQSITPGNCPGNYTITRTWSVTDAHNNTSTATQTLNVQDTQGPVIGTQASNSTVECDGQGNTAQLNAWLNNHGGATATDACSGVTWSNNFSALSDDCGRTGSATVTFTATDACGNASTTTATFRIEDTTPPAITQASNSTVECDGQGNTAQLNAWLASHGGATASDICSGVTWTNNFSQLSDECGRTGSATVTFTATDDCGNASTTTATFRIVDTTPPAITQASNSTVECDGQGNSAQLQAWLDNHGGATASDICSGVTWTNNFSQLSDDCGRTGSATVTFTATDDCGNASTTTATFTIVDTTPPAITQASNSTVECDGQGNTAQLNAWLASHGGATASDICSGVTWTNNFSQLSDDCGRTGSAKVTFTATDDCGNASTTTATFTIVDTTPPAITQASNSTVECDGQGNTAQLQAWLDNHGGATASDICSGVTWTHNFTALSDDCGRTGSAKVTFTATDDCGNASTTTATFTIVDTTPPAITQASNSTVECDGQGNTAQLQAWLASHGGATASDICSGVTWTNNFSQLSDECGRTGSAKVTFTATDDCGNASTTTATFTIVDTTPPAITQASNSTVECDGQGNTAQLQAWLASHGGATASDICSGVTWTHNFTALSDDCGRTGSAKVTFTATDDCGNASSTTATFAIEDHTAPVITCPANKTVNCQDNTSPSATGVATATDICSGAAITYSDVSTQNSSNTHPGYYNYTITRTWKATDDCGNASTCTQVITVQDITAPTAVCKPVTITLVNGAASITPQMINNGSSDICSPVTLSVSKASFNCSNLGANTVTLTVKDVSGNVSTCQATVTVVGEIPTCKITSVPTDNTYTGGVSTNLFLGYGAQSTTLQLAVPASGAPYTFSWTGNGTLSSTTVQSPLFAPTAAGTYTFTVLVTNKYGCTTTCTISICVTDIRVKNSNGTWDGKKVYVCHVPPGNPGNSNTLEISVNAVPAHIGPSGHATDRLGRCEVPACGGGNVYARGTVPPTEPERIAEIKAYPNPTTGVFELLLQNYGKGKVEVQVIDNYGKLVAKQSVNVVNTSENVTMDVTKHASGVYHVRVVTADGGVKTLRVVVAR